MCNVENTVQLTYEILDLLLGFARNLDSDFIKEKHFFFLIFCENSHIYLD